jgi:hypothetical protein
VTDAMRLRDHEAAMCCLECNNVFESVIHGLGVCRTLVYLDAFSTI